MVADSETRKPCKRQVFLFEQLMIFSEPFERKKDWTVYIYRHSIKVSTVRFHFPEFFPWEFPRIPFKGTFSLWTESLISIKKYY